MGRSGSRCNGQVQAVAHDDLVSGKAATAVAPGQPLAGSGSAERASDATRCDPRFRDAASRRSSAGSAQTAVDADVCSASPGALRPASLSASLSKDCALQGSGQHLQDCDWWPADGKGEAGVDRWGGGWRTASGTLRLREHGVSSVPTGACVYQLIPWVADAPAALRHRAVGASLSRAGTRTARTCAPASNARAACLGPRSAARHVEHVQGITWKKQISRARRRRPRAAT